jgi:hypothetical protein
MLAAQKAPDRYGRAGMEGVYPLGKRSGAQNSVLDVAPADVIRLEFKNSKTRGSSRRNSASSSPAAAGLRCGKVKLAERGRFELPVGY